MKGIRFCMYEKDMNEIMDDFTYINELHVTCEISLLESLVWVLAYRNVSHSFAKLKYHVCVCLRVSRIYLIVEF
jgi:hypothetical protein